MNDAGNYLRTLDKEITIHKYICIFTSALLLQYWEDAIKSSGRRKIS